jgi:hypothetical protein
MGFLADDDPSDHPKSQSFDPSLFLLFMNACAIRFCAGHSRPQGFKGEIKSFLVIN